jgi:glycine C-acetyltransferase
MTDFHAEHSCPAVQRTRDITSGHPAAENVIREYESLSQSGEAELLGRIFHGTVGPLPAVSFADTPNPTPRSSQLPRGMINLGSSDYAGLNDHPRVLEAAAKALYRFGNSSTGGRLLNGTTELHVRLEQRLAAFLDAEAAITYNSGYCANLSVMSCLCAKDDVVLTDILNHQSIVDGLALGGAASIIYLHKCVSGSARSIEAILSRLPWETRKFIVTDGIFSMDGDLAPLDAIVCLARKHNAFVIVDEAHAIGAYGPFGRGTVAHFGLEAEVDVITGVLSKGLPGIGGFVAGPKRTIDVLRYSSNGYIFSTALPPSVIAGVLEAIDILESDASIQDRLHQNSRRLRDGIVSVGLDVLGSESAVIPIAMPDTITALRFTRLLHDAGVFVNFACHPVVSTLRPRLRLNMTAKLTVDEINRALDAVGQAARILGMSSA